MWAFLKQTSFKIVKDANFLSFAGNLSTALAGLFSYMILLRMLSINDFGIWILFTTPASLIDMLRFGVTREALVRYLAGSNAEDKKYYLGSAWVVGLLILAGITVILWTVYLIIPQPLKASGYSLFFIWYPLLGLVTLPWNYAWSIFQADVDFGKILWIRFFNLCSFLVIIFIAYLYVKIEVSTVVMIYIATNLATSLFCIAKKWTGLQFFLHINKEKVMDILKYGRYSMATRIGSSLLKGADSFIISFSAFMGPASVALYAIPLKYIEFIEIPLLSFATTAFPKLSKMSMENNKEGFKRIYYGYTGPIVYIFIVIAMLSLVLNKYFILILGGAKYLTTSPNITYVLIVFIFYGMLMPLDRFTGIALDSLNRPDKNFQKVLVMTLSNIFGDIFAVFGLHYFFPSMPPVTILFFVAIASIIFSVIGLFIGYYFLKKEIDISFSMIFSKGLNFYKELNKRLRNKEPLFQ
ncbi:MAG: oligosaccharide flippase family protein [Bacteroidales bacterium]